jgi:hypothetical protein
MASARCNKLILRLLAGRCEIREDTANLEVHHVHKLAWRGCNTTRHRACTAS